MWVYLVLWCAVFEGLEACFVVLGFCWLVCRVFGWGCFYFVIVTLVLAAFVGCGFVTEGLGVLTR